MILYKNSMLVVRPKKPFTQWLKKIPTMVGVSMPEIFDNLEHNLTSANPSCYLAPAFENKTQATQFIISHYREIFENELFLWCVNINFWPRKLDLNTFHDWFEVDFHSALIDINSLKKLH